MPKIGAPKDAPERPYVTVCVVCGCLCAKVVSSFTPWGTPGHYAYMCQDWRHRCGDETREGCKPRRVYTDTPEGEAEYAKHTEEARQANEKAREAVRHILDDRDLGESDATGPGVPENSSAITWGPVEFAKLMQEAGCFEGTCGQCPGCRARAAGLFDDEG